MFIVGASSLPDAATLEMELLRQYCEATHRTQSDVREFIRSLKLVVPTAQEHPQQF